jgi:CHAD domain-containing protein
MPGYNPIFRHWQAELNVSHKNISILQAALNAKAIHDLRVAIKKLRCYFKFYLLLFERKEAEKLFSDTNRLFSILGKHRNIEVSRKLLSSPGKNNQALKFFFVHLQTMQKQTGMYCKQTLAKYKPDELNKLTKEMKADLENYTSEETLNKLNKVIKASFEKVKHDLKHFKDRSHLIRKALKDIFYRLSIFENPPLSNTQIKTIDKILNHLGNAQDGEVVITNLKSFRKMILPKETAEYNLIRKTEQDLRSKKDALLDKAEKMTQKLFEKL